ncbi:MAG: VWA domain-containing protein [Acidimicrobiales bacterium]|nr:MAG: VWA domain-containing protein [Acidimicrobiales bacterium]
MVKSENSPTRIAVSFSQVLRGLGLEVPVSRVQLFVEALGLVGLDERNAVYWAGRSTLVADPEEIEEFDRAFAVFWERKQSSGIDVELPPISVSISLDSAEENDDLPEDDTTSSGPTLQVRYSALETLKEKDFAECSEQELDELKRLISGLRFTSTTRPSRRRLPSKRQTRNPDLRRTVRAALAMGGEPIHRKFVQRDHRPRRLVLLVDVSGSMEPYARALIRFAHATVVGRTRVEAFAVGTRLTRITRELSSRDPDAALRAAAHAVADWSGGTRLGATLKEFNELWGLRGMARGAIVVLLSDGWDRGEPEALAEQMERLHRVSYRQIWVNPLKHTPGYAPLARGMAAALPHTDAFIEGHSFESLERLAETVSA